MSSLSRRTMLMDLRISASRKSAPIVALLVLPLAIIMRYGVIAREEAYLDRRFGDAYRQYKARVRRWL